MDACGSQRNAISIVVTQLAGFDKRDERAVPDESAPNLVGTLSPLSGNRAHQFVFSELVELSGSEQIRRLKSIWTEFLFGHAFGASLETATQEPSSRLCS